MRAPDYLQVAGTPRFRARSRSRLRGSSREATLLVVGVAAANSLWLVPLFPHAAPLILSINGVIAGVALAMYVVVRHVRHAPVELMLFTLLIVVDAGLATLRSLQPDLTVVSAGFAVLLPIIVALVVPWRTSFHTLWITIHAGLVITQALLAPTPIVVGGSPAVMIGLIVGASFVSQLGHFSNLRAQVRSFVQLQEIAVITRRLRSDEARLRELNRVLESAVQTDDLTGLRNRLALQLDLQFVRARVSRTSATFALVMLDLDRFKQVNDRLGHVAGDEVLRRVAAGIVEAARGDDRVFRFGGEEFLILAEVTDAAAGHAAAERIRAHIEDLGLPHPGNPPFGVVTLSAGVSLITRGVVDEPETAWLERADVALYAAKARGRNRVEDWGPLPTRDGRAGAGRRRRRPVPADVAGRV